ncbi:hypothetical protein [Micromonospora sp. NPDC049891]
MALSTVELEVEPPIGWYSLKVGLPQVSLANVQQAPTGIAVV